MSNPYQLTKDWFSWAPPVWKQLAPMLPDNKVFLEVGSFEGASAVWTVEHLMGDSGTLYCVDTWAGSEEHTSKDMKGVEQRFDANIQRVQSTFPKRTVIKRKCTSTHHLSSLLSSGFEDSFDFIYIDGSHTAPDVLRDMCMAFPLLKLGGIMVMDDYRWGSPRDLLHRPKVAVDAFVNINAEHVRTLHSEYQYAIQKVEYVLRG